jgi:hypothetical protein
VSRASQSETVKRVCLCVYIYREAQSGVLTPFLSEGSGDGGYLVRERRGGDGAKRDGPTRRGDAAAI